jgi:DNA-binding transcriptional ArsR family regulator
MTYSDAIQAIADPTRRLVFERLRGGPLPVGRLAEGLPVTRPAVSQHLKVLERAGLVRAQAEGTRRIYAVDVRGLEELRRYLDSFWDDVLRAFAAGEGGAPPAGAQAARGRKARKRRGGR